MGMGTKEIVQDHIIDIYGKKKKKKKKKEIEKKAMFYPPFKKYITGYNIKEGRMGFEKKKKKKKKKKVSVLISLISGTPGIARLIY